MEKWFSELVVAVPAAAAVIVVVFLFLKNQKEERISRDAAQSLFLDTMKQLSGPISELVTEVRLLRQEHQKQAS